MRRALGAITVIAAGVAALGAPVLGCSHDAKPAIQPAGPPPLPPASGTPIGYLIDARELALSEDQSTQLKAIDDDLASRLAAIDASLRQPDPTAAPPPGQESNRGRGLGFRAGGATFDRNRTVGGRETVFPDATGTGSSAPATRSDNPYVAGRATEDRDALIRDAVVRAFGLLDPVQRIVARRVLTDRGIDPSTGGPLNPPAAPPGASGPDPAKGSDH